MPGARAGILCRGAWGLLAACGMFAAQLLDPLRRYAGLGTSAPTGWLVRSTPLTSGGMRPFAAPPFATILEIPGKILRFYSALGVCPAGPLAQAPGLWWYFRFDEGRS